MVKSPPGEQHTKSPTDDWYYDKDAISDAIKALRPVQRQSSYEMEDGEKTADMFQAYVNTFDQ